MGLLRIGTSGWTYTHWRERFYPPGIPQKEWLEFYSSQFDSVEINSSFYHLPAAATFRGWKERTPADFLFAVKAPRVITHWRRLVNCEEPLTAFLDRGSKLGDKLGPILFQFPPRWQVNLPLLEEFTALLPGHLRFAFEFRDPSWLCDEVYEKLHQAGLGLCRSSSPDFPDADVITGPFVYLRMHGGTTTYDSLYPEDELRMCAERIRNWRKDGLDVYVYFNNDAKAYAVRNAKTLSSLVSIS